MKDLPAIDKVDKVLKEMGIPSLDGENSTTLPLIDQAAEMYGMKTYGKYVDLSAVEDLQALEGTVVTHEAEYSNNGVYVFCIQEDQSVGMFVLIPSTISKAPMIRQATGDLTSLISGADLPLLTTFDKVEITGFVIANTVIKPLMDSLNIPKAKRKDFERIFLPRFMSNVARQYLGSDELKEEIVEMEPQLVKQMVIEDLEKEKSENNDDITSRENKDNTLNVEGLEDKDSNKEEGE